MKQVILLFALALFANQSFSNTDFDIVDEPINNDSLDIDGSFQAPRRKSAADHARSRRRKLEKFNEMMVQKKIEQVRYQKEVELMKRLRQQFHEQMKKIDQLN